VFAGSVSVALVVLLVAVMPLPPRPRGAAAGQVTWPSGVAARRVVAIREGPVSSSPSWCITRSTMRS